MSNEACCRCGNEEAIYTENPYDSEINDNHDMDWYCYDCLEELRMDI